MFGLPLETSSEDAHHIPALAAPEMLQQELLATGNRVRLG